MAPAGEEDCEAEFVAPGDLEDQLARADCHKLVEQALQQLPAAQRVPLVLYHLDSTPTSNAATA